MDAGLNLNTLTALAQWSISYEILPCDPDLADTEVFCTHYGISLSHSANTLIITSKSGEKRYAACVLLADSRLDVNKTARKKLGVRRISFANEEETRTLTGMALGGVTAIGLPETLPIWVDIRVMELDYIILGGGNRTSKLKISPHVFQHTANTEVVENLATLKAV